MNGKGGIPQLESKVNTKNKVKIMTKSAVLCVLVWELSEGVCQDLDRY